MPPSVLAICGDLDADNTLDVEQGMRIGTALWVGGATRTSAPLTVHGDFIACGGNQASNTQDVTGRIRSDLPLACATLPSPSHVSSALDVHITQPTTQDFGDCQVQFASLTVDNTLTLQVSGHATWLIDGDVHIAAPLRVALADGASLDLWIGGALEIDNTFTVGSAGRPLSTLVAVNGPIHVAAPTQIEGSLFAPASDVQADNTLSVRGGAYLGSLHVAAPMVVHGEGAFSEDGCPQ